MRGWPRSPSPWWSPRWWRRRLEDPPCGYFITEEQYTGDRPEGTVQQRLRLHGIDVVRAPDRGVGPGYLVLMAQPLRSLIPLLLDGQAAEPMVDGVRLFPTTRPTDGEPISAEACGRGHAVPTADLDTAYELDYPTD